MTGVLAAFEHPTLKNNLTALKAIHHCALLDDVLHIELTMPFAWQSGFEALQASVGPELLRDRRFRHRLEAETRHHNAETRQRPGRHQRRAQHRRRQLRQRRGGEIQHCRQPGAGAGRRRAKVGILDADIYGPSIPNMLGTEHERPTSPDGQHMAPIVAHGLATNSIGYLVTDDNAMVWRGPMASKALMQLLQDTLWPDLDYLVLDMPPGTGDIQLTLSQNIPVTGALVVTTPQDIALLDAAKGIVMFEKVHVPVLGIVENMSVHICSNCGHHEPIFGTGGAEKLVQKYHSRLLGQMPLHISLREDLDRGTPTVISRPDSEFAEMYRQLAGRVAAQMYWQGEAIPTEIAFRAL